MLFILKSRNVAHLGKCAAIKGRLRDYSPRTTNQIASSDGKVTDSCWPCRLKLTRSPKWWINHACHLSCKVLRQAVALFKAWKFALWIAAMSLLSGMYNCSGGSYIHTWKANAYSDCSSSPRFPGSCPLRFAKTIPQCLQQISFSFAPLPLFLCSLKFHARFILW